MERCFTSRVVRRFVEPKLKQTVERERRIGSVLKSSLFGRRCVNRIVRRVDQLLAGRMSSIIFALAKTTAATAFIGGIIFLSAGRWDLPFVWAILGMICAFFYLMTVMSDPELVKERVSPGPGNVDRLTRPVGGLLLIGHWLLVGLDVGRFHWSLVPWSATRGSAPSPRQDRWRLR